MTSRYEILSLPRLPARLTVEQAAIVLGFQPHDMAVLIRHRLLRPLGNPAPSAPKYFARNAIESCSSDEEWLSKATRTISGDWKKRNQARHPTENLL